MNGRTALYANFVILALEQLLKIIFYTGLIEIGNISFVVFPLHYSMINTLLRSKHYNIYIHIDVFQFCREAREASMPPFRR